MNINYYGKKNILLNTKKKITHHKCGPTRGAGQARKVNPKSNYEAGQPGPHFAGQNGSG